MTTTSRGHSRRVSHSDSGRPAMMRLESLALILLLVLLVIAAMFNGPESGRAGETQPYRVKAGDTLWSLAEAARLPGQTTEQAVETIARLNSVADGNLTIGTTLQVPSTGEMATAQAMR